jgi:hypothetical protein
LIGGTKRPLLHPLAGGRLVGLFRTLGEHGGVSPRYAAQIATMLAIFTLRWPICTVEAARVAIPLRNVAFDPPPVFIVGHWRSGTTLLHNLMSRDPAFCFPTNFDAMLPYGFYPVPFGGLTRAILQWNLPATRPMDEVPLRSDLPQEEEVALGTMAAPSFFNCLYFPRELPRIFSREVLFEGIEERLLLRWRDALRYYLGKLQLLHPGRRLLLKNPANSARVTELRLLFPGAKFIHIHRAPHAVLGSTRKLFQRMLPLVALQDYDPDAIDQHIVSAYPRLMDRLFSGLSALPAGHVVELRFDDLLRDPLQEIGRIYRELDLDGFPLVGPKISEFLAQDQAMSRPEPGEVPQRLAMQMRMAWRPHFERLGYELPSEPGTAD